MSETKREIVETEDRPPVFKTWNQVYFFVLLVHLTLILLFFWITQTWNH
ncbi:MAG: hypothetical protein AAFV80_18190 [Bacteroidota bacterium]